MAIRMLKSLHCKSSDENDVVQPTSKCFFFLHEKTVSKLLDNPSPETTKSHLNHLKPCPKMGRPTPRLPLLMELPPGHPSRNVVEIIFHTSWFPPASSPSLSPPTVDMIYKVHNSTRALSCFEEYREMVKGMVPGGRCAADGNELMRFQYLGLSGSRAGPPMKEMQVCTFSGSGRAHRSGDEGGEGRRAMLVCRVVAGPVLNRQLHHHCSEMELKRPLGLHSVMGENDELFVEDPRALLPCFIITYTCCE